MGWPVRFVFAAQVASATLSPAEPVPLGSRLLSLLANTVLEQYPKFKGITPNERFCNECGIKISPGKYFTKMALAVANQISYDLCQDCYAELDEDAAAQFNEVSCVENEIVLSDDKHSISEDQCRQKLNNTSEWPVTKEEEQVALRQVFFDALLMHADQPLDEWIATGKGRPSPGTEGF